MRKVCRRSLERIETRARNDAVMAAAVADDFAEFFPNEVGVVGTAEPKGKPQ